MSENSLQIVDKHTSKQPEHQSTFSPENIALIKDTVAKGASDQELALFLYQCDRTGLNPLARQIYFQKFKKGDGTWQMSIITAIDGYRLIAHRTGVYAGIDPTLYDSEVKPRKATVTVYKIVQGMRAPFTASARWDQYCPPQGRDHMWRKMPHLMLEKCAEALALRKAFPAELSGIYTQEEFENVEKASDPNDNNLKQTAPVNKQVLSPVLELKKVSETPPKSSLDTGLSSGESASASSEENSANDSELQTAGRVFDTALKHHQLAFEGRVKSHFVRFMKKNRENWDAVDYGKAIRELEKAQKEALFAE